MRIGIAVNAAPAKPDQSAQAAHDPQASGLEEAASGLVLMAEAMERILKEWIDGKA